jgi:hypothetical protein
VKQGEAHSGLRGGGAEAACAAREAAHGGHGMSAHSHETASHRVARLGWRMAKHILPDYLMARIQFRREIGRWPNLRHPTGYSESILLRCLEPDMRWAALTDKLAVRDYVREKIGEAHLIPLIAVPKKLTRDVFDALPEAFVMKANHGCAFVKVVFDKSTTSFEELNALAEKWLSTDYYRLSRERHYHVIEPKLYFEQLLLDSSGKIPSDLKIHVFGGRPQGPCIQTMIITDRFGDARGDLYDEHWRRMDVTFGPYRPSDAPIARPENWREIERIAKRLAEDFAYVRVDLYSTGSQVFFGELTFTPGAGRMRFRPDSHEAYWGRMLRESIEGFERMRHALCA